MNNSIAEMMGVDVNTDTVLASMITVESDRLPESHYMGVYIDTDYQTKQPTGFYRSSINLYDPATDTHKWKNLGNFKSPETAAYVFNVWCINSLEPEMTLRIMNKGCKPDIAELTKWRAKTPLNPQREVQAHMKLKEIMEV